MKKYIRLELLLTLILLVIGALWLCGRSSSDGVQDIVVGSISLAAGMVYSIVWLSRVRREE